MSPRGAAEAMDGQGQRLAATTSVASIGLALALPCCAALWGFEDASLPPPVGIGEPAVEFSALDDPTKWSTVDVSAVHPAARGFHGGVFDGRYVYLVPFEGGGQWHGIVLRYDSELPFGDTRSWSALDLATVNAAAMGFIG